VTYTFAQTNLSHYHLGLPHGGGPYIPDRPVLQE